MSRVDYRNQTTIVTGASSGLGAEFTTAVPEVPRRPRVGEMQLAARARNLAAFPIGLLGILWAQYG
jgi:hypothetical protein